jgi:undecaprenyl-diphosphatase
MLPAEATLTAAAQALGRHALPWFFAILLVSLVAIGVIGRVLLRQARTDDRTGPASVAALALRFGLGFAIIVIAALLFAVLAEAIEAPKLTARLDLVFSEAVRQSASADAVQVFAWLTHLGDPATLTVLGVVVAVALVARGERTLALGWVVALAGNAALNRILKSVFERVRPVHDHALAFADGWSFPSGHSSGSVVAYGMLAYVLIRTLPRAWHLPALLLATAIAFVTGCSRVFLQVHHATDVAAGFASGTAWLATCIASLEMARHYRRRNRRST